MEIELSQAVFDLRQGDPDAARRLQQLAQLPVRGPARAVSWLARAQLAAADCEADAQTAAQARQSLRSLDGTVHAALPEGGAIAAEIRDLRQACETAATIDPTDTAP